MVVEEYNPHPDQILQIKSPLTGFRFEYHPGKKRVYIVDLVKNEGDPIAMDILNHGAAINAVLIFLRGYRLAEMVNGRSKHQLIQS